MRRESLSTNGRHAPAASSARATTHHWTTHRLVGELPESGHEWFVEQTLRRIQAAGEVPPEWCARGALYTALRRDIVVTISRRSRRTPAARDTTVAGNGTRTSA